MATLINRPQSGRFSIDASNPINWASPLTRGLVRAWIPLPGQIGGDTLHEIVAGDRADFVGGTKWEGDFIDVQGTTDYAKTNNPTPISGSQNRCVVMLINTDDDTRTAAGLFEISDGSQMANGERWTFRQEADGLRIEIRGDGHTESGMGITTGKWQVVGCSLDGTTTADHTLYVDHVSAAAAGTVTLVTVATNEIWIGISRIIAEFDGKIAKTLLYNRAIGYDEFQAIRLELLGNMPTMLRRTGPRRVYFIPAAVGVRRVFVVS